MTLHLDRPAAPQAGDASSPRAGSADTPRSLREVQPLVNAPGAQTDGMISPDARWLAYQSDESGTFDIYVRPYPDVNSGIRHTVSTNGGTQPRWGSSRELFYVDSRTNAMMSVRVAPGPTWSAATPEKLFDATPYSFGANFPYYNYDIAKDGRFLMIKTPGGSALEGDAPAILVVVQNWTEELKRLVPAK